MDLRLIVTNFGEENLYQDLSKEVERRLPQKQVHWNGKDRRESKDIDIKATFKKFNSDQLGETTEGTITTKPFLHLYWTSCMENDEFRNTAKQKIINWQENLKSRDISDWLIIQVVHSERQTSTRNRINFTRSSVFDRIKNDLCGKDAKRVVQFWDPKKEDLFTKSRESWVTLLDQIRQLLLESIKKHLTKCEKNVQLYRERYTDPNWSFVKYLRLNEELATIFKSVTLHNDALLQYEQIDALFSQFVTNRPARGIPPWMDQFTATPLCWDGISLKEPAVQYFRKAVYDGRASLIDLRNYIFIRQWQMLDNMHKSWDTTHKLLQFVFTVVKEMKILQTGVSYCVPVCWALSCCLEYLNSVENKEISTQRVMASLAQVYDYAREKLLFLGQECQLLPGQEPAQELVTEIVSGLCLSQPFQEGNERGSSTLLNALNSQLIFDKLYLRICGRTKSLFNSVGRVRFANRAGIDMARYYIMKRKYSDAKKQLTAALSSFHASKWTSLYIDVLAPLSVCQSELDDFVDYLESLAKLSCSETLSFDKRVVYAEKFLESIRRKEKGTCSTPAAPVITVENARIDLIKEIGSIGEVVNVEFTLRNNLLKEIEFDEIEVRMGYTETENEGLTSVDGISNGLKKDPQNMNWSELITTENEQLSPSVQKAGLFQRIKSMRGVKQKEVESKDNSNSSQITSSPIYEDDSVDSPATHFFHDDLPLAGGRPKTLAELARELPRTLSMSDDSDDNKAVNSTEPATIPYDGIQRSDSAASSLSVVSISSNGDANSLADRTSLPQKLIRQNIVSSLASNDNSNLNIPSEADSYNADCGGNGVKFVVDGEDFETQEECIEFQDEANLEVEDSKVPYDGLDEPDLATKVEDDVGVDMGERFNGGLNLDSEGVDEDAEETPNDGDVEVEQGTLNEAVDTPTEDADDCSLIEEETEVPPKRSLLAGPTVLVPGKNKVNVKAMAMKVGRYNLTTLICQMGNVFLYTLLELPRQSRAFFVVSDPPKFSWSSNHVAECFLLGNKQRFHVTLSNGPGCIHASSVIQLSSSTGLQFSPVPPSSVWVYSTSKKEDPVEGVMYIELNDSNKSEAYMYLPKCRPYEQTDLYFDAYAPVDNTTVADYMTKHEVSLKCLWLPELIPAESKMESFFYEPFTLSSRTLFSAEGKYLCTTLSSSNSIQIQIVNPQLECLNSENFTFSCLLSDIQMSMQANDNLNLIWHVQEIDKEKQNPEVLDCRLVVNFKTENDGDAGEFSKQFRVVDISQPLFKVSTKLALEMETPVYKGTSYSFDVTVKETRGLPEKCDILSVVCTLVDNDQWKYDDDKKQRRQHIRVGEEGFYFNFKTKVIPCVSGLLRHPLLSFSKTVEVAKEDLANGLSQPKVHQVPSKLSQTRLSSSRRTSASAATEIIQPFAPGEVVFSCAGQCISVVKPKKQVSVL